MVKKIKTKKIAQLLEKLKNPENIAKIKKATPGFEPGVRALQAPALPLGHVALNQL